ncbi:MAG TPA: helix-turn-helix domain-containing protein [Chryseolinea sp.]
MTNQQPSYYAVIPADVRYSDIPHGAKLLYGEITALCHKEGYCWATNEYFAGLYGISERQITRWITSLEPFIKIENSQSKARKIWITNLDKNVHVGKSNPDKNVLVNLDKNVQKLTSPNIGRVSKDINNTHSGFDQFWKAYPRRIAKKKALQVWSKIKFEPDTLQKILNSLETYKKTPQWTKDNGSYIPHPATWLNQERWDDELGVQNNEPVRIAVPEKRQPVVASPEGLKRLEQIKQRALSKSTINKNV